MPSPDTQRGLEQFHADVQAHNLKLVKLAAAADATFDEIDEFQRARADAAGLSVEEYKNVLDTYGTHGDEIIRILIDGEADSPEDAHALLNEQAGKEAGSKVDRMNKLSQKRAYGEEDADEAWRDASGEPPIEFHGKRRKGPSKKKIIARAEEFLADQRDRAEHDRVVQVWRVEQREK